MSWLQASAWAHGRQAALNYHRPTSTCSRPRYDTDGALHCVSWQEWPVSSVQEAVRKQLMHF